MYKKTAYVDKDDLGWPLHPHSLRALLFKAQYSFKLYIAKVKAYI